MLSVAENLETVHAQIADTCRSVGRCPDEVTVVAVSKRQPDERLKAAYEAGHRDFGENYVQELTRKQAVLPGAARWHLIGHLQTNKAKQAVGAYAIHTVDSVRVARAIQKAAVARGVDQQRVLIEVNLAGEASKAGLSPAELPSVIDEILTLDHLLLDGLMCIPPVGEGRKHFSVLRALRDEMNARLDAPMSHLSMGMSADYADAIAEGATIVRVGTAIFGPREA